MKKATKPRRVSASATGQGIKRAGYVNTQYQSVRVSLRRRLLTLLQTELSIVQVFAEVAQTHYGRGDNLKGDRSKSAAARALEAVRHFIESSDLLDDSTSRSISRQCDELQQMLQAIGPAKR